MDAHMRSEDDDSMTEEDETESQIRDRETRGDLNDRDNKRARVGGAAGQAQAPAQAPAQPQPQPQPQAQLLVPAAAASGGRVHDFEVGDEIPDFEPSLSYRQFVVMSKSEYVDFLFAYPSNNSSKSILNKMKVVDLSCLVADLLEKERKDFDASLTKEQIAYKHAVAKKGKPGQALASLRRATPCYCPGPKLLLCSLIILLMCGAVFQLWENRKEAQELVQKRALADAGYYGWATTIIHNTTNGFWMNLNRKLGIPEPVQTQSWLSWLSWLPGLSGLSEAWNPPTTLWQDLAGYYSWFWMVIAILQVVALDVAFRFLLGLRIIDYSLVPFLGLSAHILYFLCVYPPAEWYWMFGIFPFYVRIYSWLANYQAVFFPGDIHSFIVLGVHINLGRSEAAMMYVVYILILFVNRKAVEKHQKTLAKHVPCSLLHRYQCWLAIFGYKNFVMEHPITHELIYVDQKEAKQYAKLFGFDIGGGRKIVPLRKKLQTHVDNSWWVKNFRFDDPKPIADWCWLAKNFHYMMESFGKHEPDDAAEDGDDADDAD